MYVFDFAGRDRRRARSRLYFERLRVQFSPRTVTRSIRRVGAASTRFEPSPINYYLNTLFAHLHNRRRLDDCPRGHVRHVVPTNKYFCYTAAYTHSSISENRLLFTKETVSLMLRAVRNFLSIVSAVNRPHSQKRRCYLGKTNHFFRDQRGWWKSSAKKASKFLAVRGLNWRKDFKYLNLFIWFLRKLPTTISDRPLEFSGANLPRASVSTHVKY